MLDWAKNLKTKSSLKKTVAFAAEGNSNSNTDKIMARIDAMTMKMDARYKDFQSRSKQPNLDDDDIPMSREEESQNFMKNLPLSRHLSISLDDKPDLHKELNDFIKARHSTNSFVKDTFMDLKNKLKTTTKNHQASIQNLKTKFNIFANMQSGRPSGSLPSNTQPNSKGSSSKPYQPPQARNELVNAISTRSEFDIEIKDRKCTENVAADHLSEIEKEETSDDSEVDDNFPGETLMEINTRDEPWFADFEKLPYSINIVMPKALISDRGTHFCNKIIEKTMKRYGVNHRFSTSYHPQISGQVENTNRDLKRILEKTVKDNPAIWSRKLDDALCAFRTAYKTSTGTTPYKLIYGKNCRLPFEIEHRAYWALKNCNPDLIAAGEKRMFQLHELNELIHQA
ncbi:reverse transcriptase domain-containing protein [Tanacetum coccineum]